MGNVLQTGRRPLNNEKQSNAGCLPFVGAMRLTPLISMGAAARRKSGSDSGSNRGAKMKSVRGMRIFLLLTVLCVGFTASDIDAFGQGSGCTPPSVKAPPSLARQLVGRMFKLMETPPDERAQALHRRGGVSGLFCAEAVDLNQDGKPELLITLADVDDARMLCGAHNCPLWVYRRTSQGYQLLLEAWSDSDIEVLKTSTRGYRNIKIRQHESAVEHDVIIYKFDGRRYRPRECVTETYVDDKQGGSRVKYERWNCKEADHR